MPIDLEIELANPPGVTTLEILGVQGPAGPPGLDGLGAVPSYQETFQITAVQTSITTSRAINNILTLFLDGQKMHVLNDYTFNPLANPNLVVFGQNLQPGNFVEINFN